MRQATFELRQKLRDSRDVLIVSAANWGLDAKPWELESALPQREMATPASGRRR